MSDLHVTVGGRNADGDAIQTEMFGAIQTGFRHPNGFFQSLDALGLGHLRWPGGTLAEERPEVYGLDIDGIFDATHLFEADADRERPNLSAMLQESAGRDTFLTLIVPTARYAHDLELGASDVRAFVTRLVAGEYGALPDRVILELGNEYAFRDEFAGNPALYGAMANRFIAEIEGAVAGSPLRDSIEIAVQMGVTLADDAAIRASLDARNLVAIDHLVTHHLPISLRNAHRTDLPDDPASVGKTRFERVSDIEALWAAEIMRSGGTDPSLYLSAWTVGEAAVDPSEVDLVFQDYGLRAASTAIDLIYNYARIGTEMAAVWGVDVINLNHLSLWTEGNLSVTPFGAVSAMMAESLPGSVALPGAEGFARTDRSNLYSFLAEDRLVLYATTNEKNAALDIEVEGVSPRWTFTARVLESTFSSDAPGGIAEPEQRLFETSSIAPVQAVWAGTTLALGLKQAYAVAEIVIDIPAKATWGSEAEDLLFATPSGSDLLGLGGNDTLVGSESDDGLVGGLGDDILYGGAGTNDLWGGDGADVFVFRSPLARDRIWDFDPDADLLDLSSLVGQGTRADAPPGVMVQSLLDRIEADAWVAVSADGSAEGTALHITSGQGASLEVFLDGVEQDELTLDHFIFF